MLSRARGALRRLVARRLMRPLLFARREPEYAARGVLVGLFFALLPLLGVQMVLVVLAWLAVRAFRRAWDFNLVAALAWTWTTNVLTAPPLYYLYIVTGRVLLGRFEELRGYRLFASRLSASLPEDASAWQTVWAYCTNLIEVFGVPMFVGCVPWVLLGSWLGYRWSLRLLRGLERRRERKRRARAPA